MFQQDLDEVLDLVCKLRREVKKPIHVWSGYTFEELIKNEKAVLILHHIDTLVDGRFVYELKDLTLKYRGSSNQRVIDVKKTLEAGEVVLIDC